jgi:hypothetical protein
MRCVAFHFLFPSYSGGSWLSRRLDWLAVGTVSSLLNNTTKASWLSFLILLLIFCEKEWMILTNGRRSYEDGWCSSFCARKGITFMRLRRTKEWTHILIDGCDDLEHSRQSSRNKWMTLNLEFPPLNRSLLLLILCRNLVLDRFLRAGCRLIGSLDSDLGEPASWQFEYFNPF